jgi:hypothetical protein
MVGGELGLDRKLGSDEIVHDQVTQHQHGYLQSAERAITCLLNRLKQWREL